MLQIGQIGQIHRQIHRTSGLSKIIKGSAERLPKRTESCAHKHGTRRMSGDSRHTCAHSPAQSGNMTWKVSARAASEGSLSQLQLHRRVFAKRTASFDRVQESFNAQVWDATDEWGTVLHNLEIQHGRLWQEARSLRRVLVCRKHHSTVCRSQQSMGPA